MRETPRLQQLLDALMPSSLDEIDLSLTRVEQFLDAYGHPQRRLPPVIHVAGTNGKGSTIAFMRAIMEQAGLRVHVYTSPHLMRFRERIVIAGKQADDTVLIELLNDIKQRTHAIPLTFFEATTVAAFELMAATPADYTLLEVGMGGRLDATNVVDSAVSVITPVSLDHMEFLGDTLEEIAMEKAGIIKSQTPVVLARQHPVALQVISQIAKQRAAPMARCDLEWFCDVNEQGRHYRTVSSDIMLSSLGLQGPHQAMNAATALAAIDMLRDSTITSDHKMAGLAAVHWPARLQRLTQGELIELLPEHGELWLDGGHNEAGAASIAAWALKRGVKLHVICGMMQRKDAESFLAALDPAIDAFYAVEIQDEKSSMPAQEMVRAAQQCGVSALAATSVQQSIRAIVSQCGERPPIIMICGSLYLAGRILEKNG